MPRYKAVFEASLTFTFEARNAGEMRKRAEGFKDMLLKELRTYDLPLEVQVAARCRVVHKERAEEPDRTRYGVVYDATLHWQVVARDPPEMEEQAVQMLSPFMGELARFQFQEAEVLQGHRPVTAAPMKKATPVEFTFEIRELVRFTNLDTGEVTDTKEQHRMHG